jgi:hypothetical protein
LHRLGLPGGWSIYLLRASPAKFVGVVDAPDADAAIEKAIKEFEIKDPSRQQRLIAIRRA